MIKNWIKILKQMQSENPDWLDPRYKNIDKAIYDDESFWKYVAMLGMGRTFQYAGDVIKKK